MKNVKNSIYALLLFLISTSQLYASDVEKDYIYEKQTKIIVSQDPIAFSWSTDSHHIVTTNNKEDYVDICIYDSNNFLLEKCIAKIKRYKDVYFHDLNWHQDTILVVHGFDEGASVGKFNIEGWMRKEFVILTEKKIRWFDDLEVTSAVWDGYDNQLIFSEPLLGPLKLLKDGIFHILDKKGFNPSVNKNVVVYTYYKDEDEAIGGIGGIAKLDKNSSKIYQVTKGNDNSASISENGTIIFVKKYDNNSTALMKLGKNAAKRIYQSPLDHRIDKAKISPDGSRVAYVVWNNGSMSYNLVISSVNN